MTEERRIYAAYDDEGIYVYQAFRQSIVEAALRDGTFGGGGFKMDRMTWIKPSFGWMLYRAGYAMKEHQQGILKIKLTHEGFQQALRWGVESTWNPAIFDTEPVWKKTLKQSPVRIQWDPDRYLTSGKHPTRRAIQIGLRSKAVGAYVNEWIISLEEVTDLAHAIKHAKDMKKPFPPVPEERVYQVDHDLVQSLGITHTKVENDS